MDQTVDVSWPQNNFNPDASENGVIVAATSGDSQSGLFAQATYTQDIVNARAAGKECGHYHFNGPQDAVSSADFFWSIIRPYYQYGDLLALDIESGSFFGAQSPSWALAFAVRLALNIGVTLQELRLGIYGNLSTMRGAGWGLLEANGCWLWLAAPGGYPENTPIGEWSHWTIIQYSSAGGVDRDESQLTFAQITQIGNDFMSALTEQEQREAFNNINTIAVFLEQGGQLATGEKVGSALHNIQAIANAVAQPVKLDVKSITDAVTSAVTAALTANPTTAPDTTAIASAVESALSAELAKIPAATVAAEAAALGNG